MKVINRYHTEFKREIDVYIPELGIGLEPGHWDFHQNKLSKDKEKIELCAKNNIRIYTIYEGFPRKEKLPFDEDCYGYTIPARQKRGHLKIRDILKEIFVDYLDEIDDELWDDEHWDEIARTAHLKLSKLK